MTAPRKTPRTDAAERKLKYDGATISYIPYSFARDLEAETQELAEALERINRYLHSDRIDLWHLEANAAADLMQMRRFTDTALTRHRAAQEALK